MSAPGKSRRTTFRYGSTWIWRRRSRHCEPTGRREAPPDDRLREAIQRRQRKNWIASSQGLLAMTDSVLAALDPVLEHLQRHGAVVLGRFGDGPVVAFPDPGLVRRGAVPRERQPHQPARGLPR